ALHHADGRDETLTTRWILGCDGAHSAVRHTLGMPFEGEAMSTGFAVGDLKVDWALPDDEWHVFIHADGLFAAFPIPGGRQRLTVEVDQGAEGTPAQPTLENFQRWMRERGPAGAVVSDPARMTPFRVSFRGRPITARGAPSWRATRCTSTARRAARG